MHWWRKMSISLKPSHLATYKDVAMLFIKHGRNAKIESEKLSDKFGIDEQIEPSDNAEAFVEDLKRLGSTFIKIGQLLSTRTDLLPASWISALKHLLDHVEPFPYEDVQRIVQSSSACGSQRHSTNLIRSRLRPHPDKGRCDQ